MHCRFSVSSYLSLATACCWLLWIAGRDVLPQQQRPQELKARRWLPTPRRVQGSEQGPLSFQVASCRCDCLRLYERNCLQCGCDPHLTQPAGWMEREERISYLNDAMLSALQLSQRKKLQLHPMAALTRKLHGRECPSRQKSLAEAAQSSLPLYFCFHHHCHFFGTALPFLSRLSSSTDTTPRGASPEPFSGVFGWGRDTHRPLGLENPADQWSLCCCIYHHLQLPGWCSTNAVTLVVIHCGDKGKLCANKCRGPTIVAADVNRMLRSISTSCLVLCLVIGTSGSISPARRQAPRKVVQSAEAGQVAALWSRMGRAERGSGHLSALRWRDPRSR